MLSAAIAALAGALLVLAAGHAEAQAARQPATPVDSTAFAALRWRNIGPFRGGRSVAVAGSGDPVTTATVFRWASLSKGVAADMVALLAGEGRLSLADPVARQFTTVAGRLSLTAPGGARS